MKFFFIMCVSTAMFALSAGATFVSLGFSTGSETGDFSIGFLIGILSYVFGFLIAVKNT